MQTYLFHMRRPLRLAREMGPKSYAAFQLFFGAGTLCLLLNPLFWLLAVLWFATKLHLIQSIFPWPVLYLGTTRTHRRQRRLRAVRRERVLRPAQLRGREVRPVGPLLLDPDVGRGVEGPRPAVHQALLLGEDRARVLQVRGSRRRCPIWPRTGSWSTPGRRPESHGPRHPSPPAARDPWPVRPSSPRPTPPHRARPTPVPAAPGRGGGRGGGRGRHRLVGGHPLDDPLRRRPRPPRRGPPRHRRAHPGTGPAGERVAAPAPHAAGPLRGHHPAVAQRGGRGHRQRAVLRLHRPAHLLAGGGAHGQPAGGLGGDGRVHRQPQHALHPVHRAHRAGAPGLHGGRGRST